MRCSCCEDKAIGKHANGYWYCNKHLLSIYRSNDLNMKAIEIAEQMVREGVKRGSIKWQARNIREMTKLVGVKPKISFKGQSFTSKVKGIIAYYILN